LSDTTDEVEALDPANVRARLHQAVVDVARRRLDGPAVFSVDDGQWLDESSAALIGSDR